MVGRGLVGCLMAVFVVASLGAQRQRPLFPPSPEGHRVVPFFDGYYVNPDGTMTFSFGYSNPNRTEVVEIPLGPDNVIEPKQFDGRQPTSFLPLDPETPGGAPGAQRERERGVFTVTVPAGFKGDVTWTLRNRGQAFSVPGRARSGGYQLQWPMAMGSAPPLLGFKQSGPTGRGPAGIEGDPLQATVGRPLALTVYLNDDSVREQETLPVRQRQSRAAMNVTWIKHAGPGPIVFTPAKGPVPELIGTAATSATFAQPGEYVVRVKADNFGRIDTSPLNQCCWTNGHLKVTVKP